MSDDGLLGIYLDDHLGGASAGLELFKRATRTHRGTPAGAELARLTAEVEQDRQALLRLMRSLGVSTRTWKAVGGWLLEKAGRVKSNGRLVRRSPLSSLIELEALRLGVEGKAAGFLGLREVADRYPAIDPAELDRLVERARGQAEVLERLRLAAAREALAPGR